MAKSRGKNKRNGSSEPTPPQAEAEAVVPPLEPVEVPEALPRRPRAAKPDPAPPATPGPVTGVEREPIVRAPLRIEPVVSEAPPAPPGPLHGRAYGEVFGRVWISTLAAVRAMGRWTVQHTDPVRGEIEVSAVGLIRRTPERVSVRVTLDDLGLTRVDATFLDAAGMRASGRNAGQIRRFYRRLETLLETSGRG